MKKHYKTFKIDEIDELKFLMFIIKPFYEEKFIDKLNELGARVLLIENGEGVSKLKPLEMLGIQKIENTIIFASARSEDAETVLLALNNDYNFKEQGNGLGLIIDVDGYMGAKGLFLV